MAAGVPNPPIYIYGDHPFIGVRAQGYSQW